MMKQDKTCPTCKNVFRGSALKVFCCQDCVYKSHMCVETTCPSCNNNFKHGGYSIYCSKSCISLYRRTNPEHFKQLQAEQIKKKAERHERYMKYKAKAKAKKELKKQKVAKPVSERVYEYRKKITFNRKIKSLMKNNLENFYTDFRGVTDDEKRKGAVSRLSDAEISVIKRDLQESYVQAHQGKQFTADELNRIADEHFQYLQSFVLITGIR